MQTSFDLMQLQLEEQQAAMQQLEQQQLALRERHERATQDNEEWAAAQEGDDNFKVRCLEAWAGCFWGWQ
jgi:Ser/Thr protein kinase RdoA (MazF antagonist)